jgi:hypothetical protein
MFARILKFLPSKISTAEQGKSRRRGGKVQARETVAGLN